MMLDCSQETHHSMGRTQFSEDDSTNSDLRTLARSALATP